MNIEQRKFKHLEACRQPVSQYLTRTNGLEQWDLSYNALPQVSLDSIDMRSSFMGKPLKAPFLIGAMTGGETHGARINRNLAIAAEHLGVGLMLGSQRIMLERPEAVSSFMVRDVAPTALLIGNMGLVQLGKGYDHTHLERAISTVGADGLALHLNPLQEALQRGDTNFEGLLHKLEQTVAQCKYPLMVKEVGHGISGQVAQRLPHGLAAIDVAGAGGTCWAKVEAMIAHGSLDQQPPMLELCEVGISTTQALMENFASKAPLVASGGIRTGVQAAKALALGASYVAVAQPLLEPALHSPEAVVAWIENFLHELKVSMFAVGAGSVRQLAGAVHRKQA